MKILHHAIYLIFFSLLLTISIQADLNALETPTQHEQIKKDMNYKHLQELQNGKSLTNPKNTINTKKPSRKVKKPEIWHPKVKGVDLAD